MTVAFLDPFLNAMGPCFEYDVTIIKELEKRNVSSILFSAINTKQETVEQANTIPVLTNNNSILPHKIIKEIAAFKGVCNKIPDGSHLFIPNIFTGKSLFILSLSLLFTPSKKFKKIIYLYRFINQDKKEIFFYRLAHFFMKLNKFKVLPVADSEIVANKGFEMFGEKIEVLPIPHVWDTKYYSNISVQQQKKSINIYLPGEARMDKGITTILSAVEMLVDENKFNGYQLTLQFNPKVWNDDLVKIKSRIEKLSAKCNVNILSTLNTDDYYYQMNNADIILTTYIAKNTNNIEGYHSRTSGVFSEAVAAAKPIITTKNTWMSAQLEHYGSGIAIEENNFQELANAILSIGKDLDFYKQKALETSSQWAAMHNAVIFGDKFMALCNS